MTEKKVRSPPEKKRIKKNKNLIRTEKEIEIVNAIEKGIEKEKKVEIGIEIDMIVELKKEENTQDQDLDEIVNLFINFS
jgi:hypothetical protein